MVFDKDGNTTVIFQEKTSIRIFLENLNKAYCDIKHDHIILNLFSFSRLSANDVLEFLEISNIHRASGKSFVLVTDKVTYDDTPDELSIVPTIREAKDFIEMEEIERELDL